MHKHILGLFAGTMLGAFVGGLDFGGDYINAVLGGAAGCAFVLYMISSRNNNKHAVTLDAKTPAKPLLDAIRDYQKINTNKKVTISLEKAHNSERDVGLEINDPWRLTGTTSFESIRAEISFDVKQKHPEIAFEPGWQTTKGFIGLILLELPESLFMKLWQAFVDSDNASVLVTVELGKESIFERINAGVLGEVDQLRGGFFRASRVVYQKILSKSHS